MVRSAWDSNPFGRHVRGSTERVIVPWLGYFALPHCFGSGWNAGRGRQCPAYGRPTGAAEGEQGSYDETARREAGREGTVNWVRVYCRYSTFTLVFMRTLPRRSSSSGWPGAPYRISASSAVTTAEPT